MSWTDNSNLTEPKDGDNRPLMGVTGGQRARAGDSYVLAFEDDGEEVETEDGERAAFDVTLESSDFNPVDGDKNEVVAGDEIRLMTGSSRFLSQLAGHMPVKGKSLRVTVLDTGYQAEYKVEEE